METMKLVDCYTVLDNKSTGMEYSEDHQRRDKQMYSNHDAITYYCLYFKTSLSISFGMHKMEITLVPILLGNA